MSMNRLCDLLNRHKRILTGSLVSCFVLGLASFVLLENVANAQQPKQATSKGKTTKPKAPPAEELKIDPEALPPGYQPPPDALEIMKLSKPIASKEELEKLKKESYSAFAKTRVECDMSARGQQIIVESIRYKLGLMTRLPMDRLDELPRHHRSFVEEIGNIGGGVKPKAQVAQMADFINHEVVKQIAELLENNFYVRLHAVMILSEMDYAGAYPLLIQVIQAKDIHEDEEHGQPEVIKIAATNGLIRILRFTEPTVKERGTIAVAVVNELKNTNHHWWFQVRLIDALRYCDISGIDVAAGNHPFVVQTLLSIINDPDRHWIVRAKACYAIGRVPLPPGVRQEEVLAAVNGFALQLATAAAAKPSNPIWKRCFWDLYLAFHQENPKDMDAEKKMAGGLLTRLKTGSKSSYDIIVPLASDVLNGKTPNPADIQKLKEFLQKK